MADEAVDAGEPRRWALAGGLVGAVVLSGLVGWLGYRAYDAHEADVQRDLCVQAARRTAVDLTTIDYQHAAEDVQRVLDTTTGALHERFAASSQSLVETVTREHTQSVSAVTAAGVESRFGDAARVLVALSVASTHLGGTELPPHEIRMRVTVQRHGGDAKVSEVEYVR